MNSEDQDAADFLEASGNQTDYFFTQGRMRRIDATLDEVSIARLDQLVKAQRGKNRSDALRYAIEVAWLATFDPESRTPDKVLGTAANYARMLLGTLETELNWRADKTD